MIVMNQEQLPPDSFNNKSKLDAFLLEIKDNIRQIIQDKLTQHFQTGNLLAGEFKEGYNSDLFETIFNQIWYTTINSIDYSQEEIDKNQLQDYIFTIINNNLVEHKDSNNNSLFESQPFHAIPTAALMLSSMDSQLKKQESWQKNEDGIAVSQHRYEGHSQNYIEHYITTPGDITLLPWNEAQQIIDKFGFTSAKLHLILAAHTMEQEKPWESLFTLKGSHLIQDIGWDKRTDLPKHKKLLEIAKTAFALDCLLVKTVWIEGINKKGGINASTPVGRMWNITIVPYGQVNLSGKIEEPDEVQIIVQPGAWTKYFLNRAGAESREALYQFGYLAQEVLKIDHYHDELALRLAIYLTLNSRLRPDGNYTVQELLEIALPKTVIDKAQSNSRRTYDLKHRWDVAIILLLKLGWQITFDLETYPEWLKPNSQEKKPKGYLKKLLQAKLNIKPPLPIPKLTASKEKTKIKRLKPRTKAKDKAPQEIRLTGSQVREARIAKGWSQAKLASFLGVSQKLVSMIEKGQQSVSPRLVEEIQALLNI
jgi:DNA-binding XRE family transcriptional regulator